MNGDLSATLSKFASARPHTLDASIAEVELLAGELAARIRQLDPPAEMLVGLANGAFLPTKVAADALGVPWHMVKVRRQGSRYKQRLRKVAVALRIPPKLILWGPLRSLWVIFQERTGKLEESGETLDFDPAGRHVVLVDDVIDTGASLRHVRAMMEAAGAASVRTAVYCWADMPKVPDEVSRPDIHLHRSTQLYPWSNSSTHAGSFEQWLVRHEITLWT